MKKSEKVQRIFKIPEKKLGLGHDISFANGDITICKVDFPKKVEFSQHPLHCHDILDDINRALDFAPRQNKVFIRRQKSFAL